MTTSSTTTHPIPVHFHDLPDPRVTRTRRHLLLDIVTIGLYATLCGADSFLGMHTYGRAKYDWLKTFLPLPNGIPSHDTFRRVFARLDPDAFAQGLAHWVADLASRHPELSHIRIDGKVLRGSGDDAAGLRPLQLVSAWVDECRLVLGQVAADPDSNEITAIPKLLEILDLHGSLVTIDAAGCQSNIATAIVDGGGDYLLAVKGNQPTLEEEVSDAFLEAGENDYAGLDRAETQETNRGRQERRTCIVLPEVSVLSEAKKWPHVQGLVLVSTLRLDGDDEQGDVRYYITSRKASAAELLAATRGHWGIENRLHWVLDVTFGEDACRSHTGHSAQNLGVLRRLAVSLLQRAGGEESVKCRRLRACADNGYLEQVLQGGASPEPAKAKTSKQ